MIIDATQKSKNPRRMKLFEAMVELHNGNVVKKYIDAKNRSEAVATLEALTYGTVYMCKEATI